MSNKGATKKTVIKDESKIRTRAKVLSSSENNTEMSKKSEANLQRKFKSTEHKGDGDKSQSSLASKEQLTRNTHKQPIGTPQLKSMKQNATSSISKSSLANTSSSHLIKKSTSTKIKSETINKTSNDNIKRRSKEQKGYSEKRGISTVYVPESTASKLNIKSNERAIRRTTKDKEKSRETIAHNQTKPRLSSRERRKSRTLSPSEIRMLHNSLRKSGVTETTKRQRYKTVTANNHSSTDSDDAKYDYEDDFEDYESDFQECTDSENSQISENSDSHENNSHLELIELRTQEKKSVVNSTEHAKVEEERMLDSGHYDLAEARKRAARVESIIINRSNTPPLPELKEQVNKTYSSDDKPMENKSLPLSTDEGFEDSRSGDFTKSPPLSQIPFIDFSKENQREKNSRKIRSRGEELLEMIKLDFMEWSILEYSPIPYDEFIRNYGKLNTQQIYTQTGDDNIDIEIQTEDIYYNNKWTQFPVTCRNKLRDKRDINLFKMEQIGVGNDLDDFDDTKFVSAPTYDMLRLNDFVNRAGTVMLSLLEEKKRGGTVFQNNTDELPFSDGFVKLSINSVTFLATRSIKIIHYSSVSNKILLTIHSSVEEEIETSNKQDYITDCCIGCVWNIAEPSMPKKLFYSQCPITACCFHLTDYNVVFAGLEDGSLSLWDLKEDEMWHQKVTDKANESGWVLRTPTYTTTASTELDTHMSKIIAIRVLSKIETISMKGRNKFLPIQICSLDEDGCLIVWSIVHSIGINIDDLGLSHWGDIKLIKNQKILLVKRDVKMINTFLDMHVDNVDTNNIYIATNSTNVLHATCIGNRPNPLMYKQDEMNKSGSSTCIDVCPFGQSFFLVGCNDGTIRFHFVKVERPIVQLKNEQYIDKIEVLQWSKTKPLTIYVLDNNSRIHIWDLSKSDTYPVYTLPMQRWGRICSMQLSPCSTDQDMINQYLAFGTDSGNVEVHKLKEGFHYSKKEQFLQELDIFLQYVSVL